MSNVKSIVLDYGLPGLAMVGAGLLTFMLTGGPEEFPSVDPNEGEFSRDDEGDEYNNDEYEEGVSADLETPTNSTPIWVDELSRSNAKLIEEVRLLKEASQAQMDVQKQQYAEFMHSRTQLCVSCRTDLTATFTKEDVSGGVDKGTPEAVEKVWIEEDWIHQLCASVWLMATEDGVKHDSLTSANFSIEEESSSSFLAKIQQYIQSFSSAVSLTPPSNDDGAKTAGPDWTAACELLIMYLNNIIKNPSVPRYRRISTTNSSYMKSLLPVEKHATRLLAAVGFVKKDDSTYFEYAWHSLPSSVEVTATASSNSSSSSSSKAGADNSSSSRIPVSVEVAVRLLQRAVALLTALKATAKGGGGEGKEGALLALAELIVQQMTTASTAAATADAASGPGASLEGSGFASQQAKDGSSSGDDGLIAVVDLADEEEEEGEGAVQLGGGSAQDDSVDFMKILKKAQESQRKTS